MPSGPARHMRRAYGGWRWPSPPAPPASWSGRSPATSPWSGRRPTRSPSSSARCSSPPAGPCRSGWPRPPGGPRGRAGRVVGGGRPVRRHALLQRQHLPGAADVAVGPGLRPAGLAARRVRLGLLPGLRADRLPRLATATAGCPRGGRRGWWQPGGQPAGLHPLRRRRGRRLRRPASGSCSTWRPPTGPRRPARPASSPARSAAYRARRQAARAPA